MPQIVIIGGGFAGVWSAASAARVRHDADSSPEELSIVLISPAEYIAIRPRLYEAHPGEMQVRLPRVLDPIAVRLKRGTASHIDCAQQVVVGQDGEGNAFELSYDKLVLASGSQLIHPKIPGSERLYNVDTLPAAVVLERHINGLAQMAPGDARFSAVVIGSGFTGIEVATELVARLKAAAAPIGAEDEVHVVLVEREDAVGPELGAGPRPEIERALEQLGIEVRLSSTVARIEPTSVTLTGGERIPTSTPVWTAGMRASGLTRSIPAQRDALDRLAVDEYLRVIDVPDVLAAGDTAAARVESEHYAMQSCQHAHAMGRVAGHNAASELLGGPLYPFEPSPYVTCLDLGAAGAVFTNGFDRQVSASGAEAKQLKRTINRAIYPPVDDPELILTQADPEATSRVPVG